MREILRRGRTLPGVEEVAVGDLAALPLGHGRNDLNPFPLIIEGRETPSNQAPLVDGSIVTPEYFHLLGMTLLRGRLFSESDDDKAPQVAVINEAFARTYWPNEDPLGKRLKLPTPGDRSFFVLDHGGRRDRGCSNRIARGIDRSANVSELVSEDG